MADPTGNPIWMRRNSHVRFCSRDGIEKQPSTITPKEPDSTNRSREMSNDTIYAPGWKNMGTYISRQTRDSKTYGNAYGFGKRTPQILGASNQRYAHIGDVIVAVIKEAVPHMSLERSEVIRAVIVRTRKELRRDDGIIIRYDDNAAVVINKEGNPKGTRVFGAIA
ncbi:60S ribosomal protein L14 [Asimina triloba]